MPKMSAPNEPDGRHDHGTQPYPSFDLVLGRLSRYQPDAWHVGNTVPTAIGAVAIRDRFPDTAQIARRHGSA